MPPRFEVGQTRSVCPRGPEVHPVRPGPNSNIPHIHVGPGPHPGAMMSEYTPRYEFVTEPRGRAYEALVRLAGTACDRAGFVIRDFHDDRSIANVMSSIEPSILARREANECPGTVSLDGRPATVVEVRLDAEVIAFLQREAAGLYDWKAPNLTEDLHFIRSDGSMWAGSVSHERWGFSDMTDDEASEYVRDAGPVIRRLA